MYTDLRSQIGALEAEADVLIVGGGAAGISLALALDRSRFSVCLLESGGFRLEAGTQDLYKGESVGLEYGGLDETRFRYFGGSTNPEGWGGWCKPLDPIDFEHRDWVPYSGWPIGLDILEPYYRRAQVICELGPYEYSLGAWRANLDGPLEDFPLSGDRVETQLSQLSRPTRFGIRYREVLRQSENVSVYLNANVTEILTSADASEATGAVAVSLDGSRLRVRSKVVVVAAGGIENARILLLSGGESSNGLGNENDLVGRFFMDHPRLGMGSIEFSDEHRLPNLYDPSYKFRKRNRSLVGVFDETLVAGSLNLTPEFQREEGLLNYRAWILPTWPGEDTEAIEALKRLYIGARERTLPRETLAGDLKSVVRHPLLVAGWTYGRTVRPRRLVKSFQLVNILEPEQMPDSRISLSDQVDSLGLRRVRLDWRIGDLVKRTLARAHEAIDEELRASGVGRLVDGFKLGDEARFRESLRWVWHHMGTTRMHEDPTQGVVDSDLRLHGTSNVYVAGSSVFPTPGSDMPTLTIVALALRLADHLTDTLGGTTVEATSDSRAENKA